MQSAPGNCPICEADLAEAFQARVLNRHEVRYLQCPRCEFLGTEPPHWLAEAYSNAISSADTGLVMRNLKISRLLTCVLAEFFDYKSCFLDFAGGTGLLTRLMRDLGFDFRWQDPYCSNQMAVGFEALAEHVGFEAVTAFEAIEHMPDPMSFVRSMLARSSSRTLIFTTELFTGPRPSRDWWYFAYPTGQHISFFSEKTMQEIATRCGVRFYSNGFLHMLTARDISDRQYRRVVKKAESGLYEKWAARLNSRTQDDHLEILRRIAAVPAV